jgi:hypothetical protein
MADFARRRIQALGGIEEIALNTVVYIQSVLWPNRPEGRLQDWLPIAREKSPSPLRLPQTLSPCSLFVFLLRWAY